MTQGTLTVTDGGLQAKIVLLGRRTDLGGTSITDPPPHDSMLFAAGHG